MKTIVYVCPFVPAEWIAAHGLRPRRLLLDSSKGSSPAGITSGVCPFARAFVNRVSGESEADAVVVTTVCDQMRRAAELIARDSALRAFLMNVPTTWQTAAAQKLYIAEVRRLGGFMVRLGGKAPSAQELAEVMREYDAARSAVRAARGQLSSRQYSEAIAVFNRDGAPPAASLRSGREARGVPLALLGGPLLASQFVIFDFVERAGGYIALDATETGERTMPSPFDRRLLRDNPLVELTNAYFGSIPDAFRRPNSQLYIWLRKEIGKRGVRGIIFQRYLWCDTWHAEVQRIREWAQMPLLDLDVGDEDAEDRTASRIQSFLAMLK